MIKLELSIEETNGILHALGQLPYIQVAALIEKIKQQAERRIAEVKQDEALSPE